MPRKKPELWSAGRCAGIRKAVSYPCQLVQPAHDGKPEYREWQWQFGPVYTRTTTRVRPTCAECGELIPAHTPALFAINTETDHGAWTSVGRFLHLVCPNHRPG